MSLIEESTLSRSSESPAGLPEQSAPPARPSAIPVQFRRPPQVSAVAGVSAATRAAGLARFNESPFTTAEAVLLECCGSGRWAHRMAAHRPFHDLASLLAASDEAGYDLAPRDIAEALAAEPAPCLHHDAPRAAHLALQAAHAAYESRFGHSFVICLDACPPSQAVDQVLASIRVRLTHEVDEERAQAADELRRLARSRLVELLTEGW